MVALNCALAGSEQGTCPCKKGQHSVSFTAGTTCSRTVSRCGRGSGEQTNVHEKNLPTQSTKTAAPPTAGRAPGTLGPLIHMMCHCHCGSVGHCRTVKATLLLFTLKQTLDTLHPVLVVMLCPQGHGAIRSKPSPP